MKAVFLTGRWGWGLAVWGIVCNFTFLNGVGLLLTLKFLNLAMKFPLYILCLLAVAAVACGGGETVDSGAEEPGRVISVDDLLFDVDSAAPFDHPLHEMPDGTVALRFARLGDYAKLFNDSNYIHWADAEKIGIAPLTDTRSHWMTGRPLEKVVSCRDFYVEPLTYSRPYLVPRAAALLHEVGRRFNDTLASRGGGAYRIKVTSVLRTPEAVARLRRRNKNAVDSSVHQLGTTFDISYSRFAAFNDSLPRSAVDLKGILAEVLYAMREEGKIWVKYEKKQPCFHISARPEK